MLEDKDLVSIQEVRSKVEKAYAAWLKYRTFSQEQVDAIVERMAAAGRANARRLAELAVEETGYGNAKDKLAKNLLNADILPRRMRGMKTIGLLRELPEEGLVEYGVPMGVVAAILPTTNPTSTAIYKTLISLKAGNAIVISPHPNAKRCTCETADLLYRAALEAGAPEDIIQCIFNATIEGTNALMKHERTGVILSTGGAGIVRAAYSSGKPAFGVGPGNVPGADGEDRRHSRSRRQDRRRQVVRLRHGLLERAGHRGGRIVEGPHHRRAEGAQGILLQRRSRTTRWRKLLVTPNFTINAKCVGQAPTKIAQMAGFEIPPDAPILVVELGGVGKQHPLSAEKLSPVLALYFVRDFDAAMDVCDSLLRFGGLGHTCVHLFQGRRAHPPICRAHARVSRAGEHADAARIDRHHHQRLPRDDAGLRRHGRQHHQRQRRAAAPDQHQAPGLRGAPGRRCLHGVRRGVRRRGHRSGRPQHRRLPRWNDI